MMSQILRDVRRYEEKMEQEIPDGTRPRFHLSARVGWMNDPNGFSFYNGEYHLFYQYHPFSTHWGLMHWGHAVSTDLLHWRYLPAALAPDTGPDRGGCYSGSAALLPDGRQLLMYTGISKETQPDGSICDLQAQCIAVGDGTDYEKYAGNPILDSTSLPENASRYDFRDPKIWRRDDGSFRCVVGSCDAERDGQVLLFGSQDGFTWHYEKILASNRNRFGKMWECPDLFALDGKHILLISPQDMLPQGLEYHNGNGTVCLTGTYDEETDTFHEENDQAIDHGIDFYAPQTILAPDGRRIMIGWMQNWDTCEMHRAQLSWFGQMSLPRELSVRDGRLFQDPIRELETIRGVPVKYENVTFTGNISLDGISGRRVDMEISVQPAEGTDLYQKFAIRFAQNDTCYSSVSFRPRESTVKIDRRSSGSRRAAIHQRRAQVHNTGGRITMRLILDNFSAELFVSGGRSVMSMTYYTDLDADGISFFADGSVIMDVTKYELTI